jgi:hypothetical protein
VTTQRWHRSKVIPGRLATTNGADILDPGRISVAVDRPDPSIGQPYWTIRVWLGNDPKCSDPYDEDTKRDAKRIAERFLTLAAAKVQQFGHPIDRCDVRNLISKASAAYYTELNERDRAELGF